MPMSWDAAADAKVCDYTSPYPFPFSFSSLPCRLLSRGKEKNRVERISGELAETWCRFGENTTDDVIALHCCDGSLRYQAVWTSEREDC
jgi:hypothetical protein